jgi:demethylmenaquinone methyltransferase/2-methoxy-6-polyprenyl-1,4-benzoquinol methylase
VRTPRQIAIALDDPDRKQAAVDWVFGSVARRYDLGNDLMSLGWHTRWKRRLVASLALPPGARVLDLATGTGDVAWMVAERLEDGLVVGVDIHPDMLELAERRRRPTRCDVRFDRGDATALPYPDGSFDLVVCAYAGRGFPSWPGVAAEAFRVLRPGGRFANLDFARPRPAAWDALVRGWMTASGALLGLALHGNAATYTYIPQTIARYAGQRWLSGVLRDAGFEGVAMEETWGTLMAFHAGHRPLNATP